MEVLLFSFLPRINCNYHYDLIGFEYDSNVDFLSLYSARRL